MYIVKLILFFIDLAETCKDVQLITLSVFRYNGLDTTCKGVTEYYKTIISLINLNHAMLLHVTCTTCPPKKLKVSNIFYAYFLNTIHSMLNILMMDILIVNKRLMHTVSFTVLLLPE